MTIESNLEMLTKSCERLCKYAKYGRPSKVVADELHILVGVTLRVVEERIRLEVHREFAEEFKG